MTKTKFCVPSCDQMHTLAGVVYLPAQTPKGLFHVVHGMTEHIGRYDRFMTALAQEGYLVFGYDHLGHGATAKDASELGYIAKKNGYDLLAQDVKQFSQAVRKEYSTPDHPLPYYLMGHSMGSFVTRWAVAKGYVKPDRFLIMGTGGNNPAAGMGLCVIAMMKGMFGDHHVSSLVYALAFGSYNQRFKGEDKKDVHLWLTNDKAEREKYCADPYCSFRFTVSAMGDLVRLNKITNEKRWYQMMPKDLPILLLSGAEDPVGNYGKGVRQVTEKLQKEGIAAECILYPNARHEILNDFTYETVKQDILTFLQG